MWIQWNLLSIPLVFLTGISSLSHIYRRKAKEETDILGPKEKRQRRPERGIKIYVPDYRSKAL